jgi:transposase InsO family protein
MDIHKNARLTPVLRYELVQRVLSERCSLSTAAAAFNVSPKTAAKWTHRFLQFGRSALCDRSSRPHRLRRPTPSSLIEQVAQLRRQRWTGTRIAHTLALSPATVSRILCRLRLNRLRDLEPPPPVVRYEYPAPGDLLHLDIKKLARFGCVGHRIHGNRKQHVKGVGWEYFHVAIDDHSRLAFSQLLPNEKGFSAASFFQAALAFYQQLGIRIRRVLTDNGPCYKSLAFRALCQQYGIIHLRTRPYTPRTNGKAERIIQTALREWAYAYAYPTSQHRQQHLSCWLFQYNCHRPHASLGGAPPISRAGSDRNNLLIQHS